MKREIPGTVTSFIVNPNEKFRIYDPVVVHLVDYGQGRGAITMACYNMAWTAYFGAMGPLDNPKTIAEFVKGASVDYLINKFRGEFNQRLQRVDKYLGQVIMTVQAALPALSEKCPECEGGRYEDPSHGCTRTCRTCNGTGRKAA